MLYVRGTKSQRKLFRSRFQKKIEEGQGIEALLRGLPDRLKLTKLQTLGIVVDADTDVAARWQAVCNKLRTSGYQNLPTSPPAEGLIHEQEQLPKIGVYIMPDNQLRGNLEDFVTRLVSDDDIFLPKAEAILQDFERDGTNLYPLSRRPKALIYTWLAWQKKPGMSMNQAITAKVLQHDAAIARLFFEWINQLFNSSIQAIDNGSNMF